jgi:hypothetical protein
MFRATWLAASLTAVCVIATSGCVASPDGGAGLDSACGPDGECNDDGGMRSRREGDDDLAMDGARIRNSATDRCLTAAPGELFAVATGCSTTSPFQQWDVDCTADGACEIVSVGVSDSLGEGICLTLGVPEPGAEPTLNPCDGSVSQAWEISAAPGSPGTVTISNLDQFLEAGSAGPNVIVGPFAQLARQRWRLLP